MSPRPRIHCLRLCLGMSWVQIFVQLNIHGVADLLTVLRLKVLTLRHPKSPNINIIVHVWDDLEQVVKGHHIASTNLTELWTALANIWQVIPLERFQKYVESMIRLVAAIMKAR
ncbi:transposable element Tcb2 transposase [Trichonephila clavipes]|nr:transposable element Tcb2 transposase [Trichonephila clavipes]